MYPCPSFRVFFSTDSLAIFEAIALVNKNWTQN